MSWTPDRPGEAKTLTSSLNGTVWQAKEDILVSGVWTCDETFCPLSPKGGICSLWSFAPQLYNLMPQVFLGLYRDLSFPFLPQITSVIFLAPIWSTRDRSQLEAGPATLVLLWKYQSLGRLQGVPGRLHIPPARSGVSKTFYPKSD